MSDNAVFYDPQRKRWRRLRRVFDVLALVGLVVGVIFVIGLLRIKPLPELLLPSVKRNYRALTNPPRAHDDQAGGVASRTAPANGP